MPDTIPPKRILPGDAIPASWYQKIASHVLQRVTVNGASSVRRSGTSLAIDIRPGRGGGDPAVYQATADASGDPLTVTVKAVEADGTQVGDEITLQVLP